MIDKEQGIQFLPVIKKEIIRVNQNIQRMPVAQSQKVHLKKFLKDVVIIMIQKEKHMKLNL